MHKLYAGRVIGTVIVILLLSLLSPAADQNLEIESYQDVVQLFDSLGYTPDAWQAGIREVPRVYLTNIPERWRTTTTHEITVQLKKRLFFRALAPLVLHAQEYILTDRQKLDSLWRGRSQDGGLPSADADWLRALADRYELTVTADNGVPDSLVEELLRRVDIVPVSLALSQSAEESGWGTSRFAAQGNALFGQWTWGENAIKPELQRKALGDYGLAAFETPLQSVLGYMHNLNTHRAYAGLRARRARLRSEGKTVSGYELAESLDKYSERGEDYVKSLHSIMRVNHLPPADSAYLGDGAAIYLVPASADPETK